MKNLILQHLLKLQSHSDQQIKSLSLKNLLPEEKDNLLAELERLTNKGIACAMKRYTAKFVIYYIDDEIGWGWRQNKEGLLDDADLTILSTAESVEEAVAECGRLNKKTAETLLKYPR